MCIRDSPSIQPEAEMAYDFQRSNTQTFSDGVSTEAVTSHLRTLHGFLGPKFRTGSGPFRVFVTGKVGFENFSITNQNAGAGFTNTVGLTNGARSSQSVRAEVSKHWPARSEFEPKSAMTSTSSLRWERSSASKLCIDFPAGGLSEAAIFCVPSNRMIRMLVW